MTQPTIQYSCVRAVYALRHACLRRDWNTVKAELAWAQKNGAVVEAEGDDESVLIKVGRDKTTAHDLINDLDPRDVTQIIESLRTCGVTIKETTKS